MRHLKVLHALALLLAIVLGVLGLIQTPTWWAGAVVMGWIAHLISIARERQ
ncbi:MAG: hypothetical protein KC615_24205 [Anaerolineae bacterium]|nr:hypothetical protein [Anaerolineae bacterium]MCA9896119.1 hypothetical protein [Anaerolineae bacterium]MCB9458445.1 hypothetical protein [Anaerolineaceae bacterium]